MTRRLCSIRFVASIYDSFDYGSLTMKCLIPVYARTASSAKVSLFRYSLYPYFSKSGFILVLSKLFSLKLCK